jgi:hypothetical protein
MDKVFEQREGNAATQVLDQVGRIDALPGHYLDRLALAIASRRRQRANQKRHERARIRK